VGLGRDLSEVLAAQGLRRIDTPILQVCPAGLDVVDAAADIGNGEGVTRLANRDYDANIEQR
jgi:hypothetical protein